MYIINTFYEVSILLDYFSNMRGNFTCFFGLVVGGNNTRAWSRAIVNCVDSRPYSWTGNDGTSRTSSCGT